MNPNTSKELHHALTYFDIDRSKKLKLSGWFQLFQEVAIRHAEEHQIGAVENVELNTTWVINRIRCKFYDYPGYKDEVLVKTWSTGINKFKGYRDFSVYKDGICIAEASSLWLHIDIDKKAFSKVPQQLIDSFPTSKNPPLISDVEKTKINFNGVESEFRNTTTLRYDDVDSNNHINNTVYLNLLQTALSDNELNPHPNELFLHFQQEIKPEAKSVTTELFQKENEVRFRTITDDNQHAIGYIR